ncbi:MAG: choice-of-anchor X domain-containing protein [Candidatus Diapherotrites archaeon]
MKNIWLLFMLLFATVSMAASNGYWLRGDDFTSLLEGTQSNFMTANSPNASSSKTVFSPNEEGVLGKWYTSSFPRGLQLHTSISFWVNNIESSKPLIWELYEYNSKSADSKLITTGTIESGKNESEVTLEQSYTLASGSRLKVVLKLEDGKITLDEGDLFSKSEWDSPSGETFNAIGISSTALLFLNQCDFVDVTCTDDLSCNDSNPFTQDTCNNPGTCSASCSYSACEPSCINGLDCVDKNPLTIDVCKNSGTCQAECSSINCNSLCSVNSDCDDNNPETKDICQYSDTCFAFCENEAFEGTITEKSCTINECIGTNCTISVSINCCGNDFCEQGETCDEDCSGNTIEIINPMFGDYLNLEEDFNILVNAGIGKNVTATGFFGTAELFDDGKHNDENPGDGIYGNNFRAPSREGFESIEISDGSQQKSLQLNVIPLLETILNTNNEEFIVTDSLEIFGTVSRKSSPVAAEMTIIAENSDRIIFETKQELDKFGNFNYSYKSFSLDPIGIWNIKVSAEDDSGNIAHAEKKVRFMNPESSLPIEIEVVKSINAQYSRGEQILISVRVREEGILVNNAVVKAFIGGEEIEFTFEDNGSYALQYVLPTDFSGNSLMVVILAKVNGLTGRTVLESEIKNENLFVNIISPTKKVFSIGEKIDFEFKVIFESGADAKIVEPLVVINGTQVETERNNGYFVAKYVVENDEEINVSINAQDNYENSGSAVFNASVSGYSLNYYFSQYWLIILVVGLAIIIGLFLVVTHYQSDKRIELLEKQEKKIKANLINVQERYFKLGALSRSKYDGLMLKYEQELQAIRRKKGEKK